MIEPLKQTEIGQIITSDNMIGDLNRVEDYASDFLHMVNMNCQDDELHKVYPVLKDLRYSQMHHDK